MTINGGGGATGILLVAVGILLLYIILSDKYQCFTEFFACMTGADMRTPEGFIKQPATGTPPIVPKQQTDDWFHKLFPNWPNLT